MCTEKLDGTTALLGRKTGQCTTLIRREHNRDVVILQDDAPTTAAQQKNKSREHGSRTLVRQSYAQSYARHNAQRYAPAMHRYAQSYAPIAA